jgi:hypothetical protein
VFSVAWTRIIFSFSCYIVYIYIWGSVVMAREVSVWIPRDLHVLSTSKCEKAFFLRIQSVCMDVPLTSARTGGRIF